MSDESTLRDKAREAIRAGTLPNHRPERMWGGPGAGVACAVCGELVGDDQLGFELEFGRERRKNMVGACAVHVRCLAAWEQECNSQHADAGRTPATTDSGAARALRTTQSAIEPSPVLPEAIGAGNMPSSERPPSNGRDSA